MAVNELMRLAGETASLFGPLILCNNVAMTPSDPSNQGRPGKLLSGPSQIDEPSEEHAFEAGVNYPPISQILGHSVGVDLRQAPPAGTPPPYALPDSPYDDIGDSHSEKVTVPSRGRSSPPPDDAPPPARPPVDREALTLPGNNQDRLPLDDTLPRERPAELDEAESGEGSTEKKKKKKKELRILGELASGGMGTVYHAIDMELRRELAVKVSAADMNSPEGHEFLIRFLEEAQVTGQLEHPNIIPIHQLGVNNAGRVFFTMKLVHGDSLESIIDRRREGDPETLARYGLRTLLDIFLQACQAVEYAHARGVVHRDLKPANIMVGQYGEVLVMDWGVTKVLGRKRAKGPLEDLPQELRVSTLRSGGKGHETQVGSIIGTPAYMAPEQARGDVDDIDERTDIYALGTILYEILCGEPPFEAETAGELVDKVLTETPVAPSKLVDDRHIHIPPTLEELALRLLAKDKKHRSITIPQIRAHLHDYIEGIGRTHRPETLGHKVLWSVGAFFVFVFLFWYLTGTSVAGLLSPPGTLNAAGWFLLITALGYPLWAFTSFFRKKARSNRFRAPKRREVFTSGFLAHRRVAAAVAPLFQLLFLLQKSVWLVPLLFFEAETVMPNVTQQTIRQLRGDWYHALIIPLVFLFGYIFLRLEEVRLARNLDRYEPVIRHSRWEFRWTMLLVVALVAIVVALDMVAWNLSHGQLAPWGFVQERILHFELNLWRLTETVLSQAAFLAVGLGVALSLVYPFPELLAALRLPYQLADEAAARGRKDYFLRSISIYHLARWLCLYGGTLIACITAMTVLSTGHSASSPLLLALLHILAPALLGLAAFAGISVFLSRYLAQNRPLTEMVRRSTRRSKAQELKALYHYCSTSTWRSRLSQFIAPLLCLAAYALWISWGTRTEPLAFIEPVVNLEMMVAIPYVLLVPVILARDGVHASLLRRRYPDLFNSRSSQLPTHAASAPSPW
jgi:serine/threonine protein kinase